MIAYRDGEALVLKHADPSGGPLGYFDSWEASTIELPLTECPPSTKRDDRMKRLFGERRAACTVGFLTQLLHCLFTEKALGPSRPWPACP